MIALVHALLAASLAVATPAPVHRVAVIVGANKAAAGRSPLRFSYDDARSMADVLEALGSFRPDDVVVLEDPEPAAVLSVLDTQLAGLSRSGDESVLLFYYSGHADEQALYPNGKPLPYTDLRRRLESPAATVRLGIIDACAGGGWTQAKGLHADSPFPVDGSLALTAEGSMLIASSSGVESAREAEDIHGSFFTHHFVAGLRGAADARGDGRVTATEAFAYARELTIRDSAMGGGSPQHPSFAMNLHGRDDFPLTQLAGSESTVLLKQTEGPLQLINLDSGLLMMEAPAGRRALWMAVPPGHYLVRRQTSDGVFAREVSVKAGETASVEEQSLALVGSLELALKGPEMPLQLGGALVPARSWHRFELTTGIGINGVAGAGAPSGFVPWPGLAIAEGDAGLFIPFDVILGVNDRLNLSLTTPAVGILLGRPRDLEVIIGAGLLSWQFAVPTNNIQTQTGSLELNPGVRVMLRKWFDERRALNVGVTVSTELTFSPPSLELNATRVLNTLAYVGVSMTAGERWTFNLALHVSRNLTNAMGVLPVQNDFENAFVLGIGSVQSAGVRPLPAVEFRIGDHWSLYGDMQFQWNFWSRTLQESGVAGVRVLF